MKVVLFCGGLGTRLREYPQDVPKPMVKLGVRPILWHVMKYYAHFGHKEFILCLGYRGETIKRYFLEYDEWVSNDFTMHGASRELELAQTDLGDWKITFVETGLNTPIGERLRITERWIGEDEMFMANYADGLTDLDLNSYIDEFSKSGKTASFLAVPPSQTFHVVDLEGETKVRSLKPVNQTTLLINGGYFIFRRKLFEYLEPNADMVATAFPKLIAENQVMAHRYDRFWCMDTFKEQQELSDLSAQGKAPWEIWRKNGKH